MIPGADSFGIAGPVRLLRCVDGDTIVVEGMYTKNKIRVRLRDVWVAERRDDPAANDAAMEFIQEAMTEAPFCVLWVPVEIGANNVPKLMGVTSFDRVLGVIYVGHESLNKQLVDAGLASATKGKR